MPPTLLHFLVLSFSLALALLPRQVAAENPADRVNVTAADPRVIYTGSWDDTGNGDHKHTSVQNASVTLLFNGTGIYWYSDIDPRGALARVTLDGGNRTDVDIAANATEVMNVTLSAVQYSRTDLDPTRQHNITIGWQGTGRWGGPHLTFYRFEYDPLPEGSVVLPSGATASSTATPDGSLGGKKGVSAGAIAGGVVGGVAVGAAIVLLALCLLRRRRRAQAIADDERQEQSSRPFTLDGPNSARTNSTFNEKATTATGPSATNGYVPPAVPSSSQQSLSEVSQPASARTDTRTGLPSPRAQQMTQPGLALVTPMSPEQQSAVTVGPAEHDVRSSVFNMEVPPPTYTPNPAAS